MSETTNVKTLAIIEDNEAVAEAFSFFISETGRYVVSGIYHNAEDAIEALAKTPVDIVLMDISLPGMDGISATRIVKEANPETDILIISVSSASENVFEALRCGASGYLTKNIGEEELLDAIDQVVAGGAPMSAQIAKLVVASFQINRESPLSERETEVLSLLSGGKSYSRIADEIFVARETVKTHIKNIYSKLHVNSKAEAIEKKESMMDKIKDAAEDIKDKAEDLMDKVEDAAEDAWEKTKEVAGDVKEKAGEFADKAEDAAEGAWDKTKEMASEAKQKAGEFADKAEDVVQIDLHGKSEMGDYMVICSGRSSRQVAGISEKLHEKLKAELGIFSKIEGKGTGDWILVDTGDVIVHVFRPEVREFYQLEKMWLAPDSEPNIIV